jgi:hypothetical protein
MHSEDEKFLMFLIDDSTEITINVIPSYQDIGVKGSKALI